MDRDPTCRCGCAWSTHFRGMAGGLSGLHCLSTGCSCRLFIHGGLPGPVVTDRGGDQEVIAAPQPTPDVDGTSLMFSLLEPYDVPR